MNLKKLYLIVLFLSLPCFSHSNQIKLPYEQQEPVKRSKKLDIPDDYEEITDDFIDFDLDEEVDMKEVVHPVVSWLGKMSAPFFMLYNWWHGKKKASSRQV